MLVKTEALCLSELSTESFSARVACSLAFSASSPYQPPPCSLSFSQKSPPVPFFLFFEHVSFVSALGPGLLAVILVGHASFGLPLGRLFSRVGLNSDANISAGPSLTMQTKVVSLRAPSYFQPSTLLCVLPSMSELTLLICSLLYYPPARTRAEFDQDRVFVFSLILRAVTGHDS